MSASKAPEDMQLPIGSAVDALVDRINFLERENHHLRGYAGHVAVLIRKLKPFMPLELYADMDELHRMAMGIFKGGEDDDAAKEQRK